MKTFVVKGFDIMRLSSREVRRAFIKVDNYWSLIKYVEHDGETIPVGSSDSVYCFNMTELGHWSMPIKDYEEAVANGLLVFDKDWEDLDWRGTAVWNDNLPYGWISPEGVFYGCAYENHDSQAELVHKKDEDKLVDEGWIKVYRDFDRSRTYDKYAELTFKQICTLNELGFDVKE